MQMKRIEASGLFDFFDEILIAGKGVSEMRIDYGPGYRVYFRKQGRTVIILLAGGDKRTQSRDIKRALRLARNL